ncbi:MAG: hypothetical protein A7316_07320 [Candidatus Altiarchaeales archaeon WOR_SM1_86-2]|nr:MAG: hypothetical protein A7316_07320 [Candidatus Altiarchaeales archaeon WOR_SM1_86-2]ODS40068.1 MAG: hypothetical protein A7315_09700 [Candidatus Altiarchaeales archaeon WOR_SM1_79]
MIMSVGRVCKKVTGRDAGNYCVVIGKLERNSVLVDGKNVRRRKVSIGHLEPLPLKVKVGQNADTENVVKALEKEGLA